MVSREVKGIKVNKREANMFILKGENVAKSNHLKNDLMIFLQLLEYISTATSYLLMTL